jgi:nucleotide-binding universal stress UspA family protein
LAEINMSAKKKPSSPAARRAEELPALRRVLVTTDFSELGDQAIPFAYALAGHGGVVRLLHVVEPYELPGPLVPHYERRRPTKREHIQHKNDCARRLEALVPAGAAGREIVTETEVIEDHRPARAICRAAEAFEADAICLASHGRSALLRAVLGSVAAEVLAGTRRPVFLIRPRK